MFGTGQRWPREADDPSCRLALNPSPPSPSLARPPAAASHSLRVLPSIDSSFVRPLAASVGHLLCPPRLLSPAACGLPQIRPPRDHSFIRRTGLPGPRVSGRRTDGVSTLGSLRLDPSSREEEGGVAFGRRACGLGNARESVGDGHGPGPVRCRLFTSLGPTLHATYVPVVASSARLGSDRCGCNTLVTLACHGCRSFLLLRLQELDYLY
ncbi:hypothetical protein Mapa_017816 [Marchantia paleacea]|nr:hypothetical protein Mapa_017816 [Marchantia paleacea]